FLNNCFRFFYYRRGSWLYNLRLRLKRRSHFFYNRRRERSRVGVY
ncbi:hypothetical protein CP061683_0744B, partial [Chlamydia psittaci 06-1683]